MANAKKCDICGKFYVVPEVPNDLLEYDHLTAMNTSMVRILRRTPNTLTRHDVTQFDACDECLQDVMDYILSRAAESAESEETESKNLYLD